MFKIDNKALEIDKITQMKRAKRKYDGDFDEETTEHLKKIIRVSTNEASVIKRFSVKHPRELELFDRISMTQPKEIGHFSTFADQRLLYDQSNLLKYQSPQIGVSLLDGFDRYTPSITTTSPSISPIIECMQNYNSKARKSPISKQFFTYRNNLNKILGTPYNTSNDWSIDVEKKDGCVYLNVINTNDIMEKNNPQMKGCYAGRRFEVYSTIDSDNKNNRTDVNECDEYCGVFEMMLKDKHLIVAAEIDCYRIADDGTKEYVELKTCRNILTEKNRYNFERYKLLSYWIQSYIVGTPTIVCGFRDDKFVLKKLQTFKTEQIPSYCKKYWKPRVCLAFAHALLDWIDLNTNDDKAYCLKYVAKQHVVEMCEASTVS